MLIGIALVLFWNPHPALSLKGEGSVGAALASQESQILKHGLVIAKSTKVTPGDYLVTNSLEDGSGGAITVSGSGITVDFKGAILRGTSAETEPDQRTGTGLIVKGKNVTIKNLVVRGYKVGVFARGVKGLKLIDCDFSYNWKQRLHSTPEREDESDWMSFHQNEKDEWLRYGAGAYLRDCDNVEVRGCTAVGGQCGLMMTGCDKGLVWNNNFSFLSAIGVGMYRCNENRVMHNNIDWCVRGYSHGVYNRGQDSAGILVYEQSNKNVFAYNSVTHGGDGFFLWAGQTTMDTGQGGCNGNHLYGNDFSHAVTNGIEATFSYNMFVNNLIMECWHGIWGGYSYQSKSIGNWFQGNAVGIAWEHGQDNEFLYDTHVSDRTAVHIWQNISQDPDWKYPKTKDTRSRDNSLDKNVIKDCVGPAVIASRTASLTLYRNRFENCFAPEVLRLENINPGLKVTENVFDLTMMPRIPDLDQNTLYVNSGREPKPTAMLPNGNKVAKDELLGDAYFEQFANSWTPYSDEMPKDSILIEFAKSQSSQPLRGGNRPFFSRGSIRGRKYIIIDEWGPYDFKSPRLVERGEDNDGRVKFDVLGPSGDWKIKETTGVKWSSETKGSVPGSMLVELEPETSDIEIVLLFSGGEVTDYRGIKYAAGTPIEFKYSKFNAPIHWNVKWFSYDRATQDPRTTDAWKTIMAGTSLREETVGELNYAWGGSPGEGVPGDGFLTLAEGTFEIKQGNYVIEVTSDDGVRVYLDDKMEFEDWTWHAPKTDEIPLRLGGKHKIKIEHFELDGYSVLKSRIRKGK